MKNLSVAIFLITIWSLGHAQSIPGFILAPVLLLSDTSTLPLRNFTVTQKDNKALLRWKTDSTITAESFYAVERSNNGTDFNLVGIIKNAARGWSEFIDDSPPKGKIFYRVKLSEGQASYYSEIVAAAPFADATCKFYPNPVDKVLIIRSEYSVDVQISDRSGKALITEKSPAGLKIIDVSSLEPGFYVITLFQKETNRLVTEKLVKK